MNGEQKKDELSELRFESDLLKFTSEFKRFIISIVDEHIERRTIEEKAKAKEEKADIVFYTVEEVCKILKISRASLYIYTHKKGWLKFHRIGRRILFFRADVLAAVTSIKKYERNIDFK